MNTNQLLAAALLSISFCTATRAQNYQSIVLQDNPVSYWRLGDSAGTTAVDSVSGFNGTAAGGVTFGQSGALLGNSDTAASFDGAVGTKIEVPYSAQLNQHVFSAELWALCNDQQGQYRSPLTSRTGTGTPDNYTDTGYIFYAGNNNNWQFWIGAGGSWVNAGGTAVVLGQWTHLVGTYDGTNQIFYINGNPVVTNKSTAFVPNPAVPLRIAAGATETAGSFWFPGKVDEVAYYATVLSPQRIKLHYQYGVYGPNAPVVSTQPRNANVAVGATATIGAVINGADPVTYQWYYTNASGLIALANGINANGAFISGSTVTTLTLTNLATADSGYYFVVASNNFGSVTSSLAQLQVYSAPFIASQSPSNSFSLYPNQVQTLSVTAIGVQPLGYQWFTNGVADASGTNSTYATAPAQAAFSGYTYQCVVSNAVSSATSTLVTENVLATPGNITNAYSQAVLALNPTGYWPMHESATAAHGDIETNYGTLGAIGNGYYGDWSVNGGSPGVQGLIHQVPGALAGDGNTATSFERPGGGYLLVPRISAGTILKPPFTLEAWVKPYDGTFGIIVGEGGGAGLNAGPNRGGFSWNWSGSASTFSLTVYNGNGTGSTEPKTLALYPFGQWYHVATTFDGSNVTYFINGAQAGLQNASTASMNPDVFSPLCIGAGRWGANAANLFGGIIDEVAIYTNVLSDTDINNHYSAGVSSTPNPTYQQLVMADSPLLYYHMDAPSYTTPPISTWPVMTNYGSAAGNGVYRPGVTPGSLPGISASGTLSASLSGQNVAPGNGLNMFADAGFNPAFNPVGRVPITISAWFKGNPADSRFQNIIGHSDSSWRIALNTNGKLQCTLGTNSTSVLNSAGVYNDGQWHQVVEVYTPATVSTVTGTNSLYVDGILDTTVTTVTTNGIGPGSTLDVMIAADPQYTNNPVGAGRQLDGSVCEAAFWNGVALNANDVQALYNSTGLAPFFTRQPVTAIVNQNNGFTNISTANGSAPISYQWYQNGAPVSGQTGSNLVYVSTLSASAGNYYVVAHNSFGSVTSSVVTLTVNSAPTIVAQFPVAYTNLITLFAGANTAFSVSAVGAQPLIYQWRYNGAAISGATNSSYTLANAQPGNSGGYDCVVTNSVNSAQSTTWNVSIIAAPTGNYEQRVLADHPVGFWALNEGPDDGSGNQGVICHDYVGGNNGIYTNVNLGQVGYNQTYDPSAGSVAFGETGLSFYDSDANSIQGIDFSGPTNTSGTFSIEAWVNAYVQNISSSGIVSKGYGGGGEQFDLDIYNNGYRFFMRDAAGTVHSVTSTIPPDGAWHHLVGVCDEVNGLVSLYIDGSLFGTAPVTAGSGVLSATNLMTIGSRPSTFNTNNNLQFYGFIDNVAAYNYALTANEVAAHYLAGDIRPIITQQPVNTTNVNQNSTLTITASVVGTPPLSFQWFDQNANSYLPGQTNATLVINNISGSDSYYLTVTNAYGSTNSDPAYVNVISGGPQIYADITPQSVVLLAGKPMTYSVLAYGTAPIFYQWYQDGAAIAAATNTTLQIATVAGTHNYYCVISNTANGGSMVTSGTATAVGVVLTDNYAKNVVGNNPVSYWRLDETSGTTAYDLLSGNNGINSGSVTLGEPGALLNDTDMSYGFDGTTGKSDVPYTPQLNTPVFTIECWAMLMGAPTGVYRSPITSRATGGYGYVLYAAPGDNWQFWTGNKNGTSNPWNSVVGPLVTYNQWTHLVGTYDGTNQTLYVNGVQAATAKVTVYPNTQYPLRFGSGQTETPGALWFPGLVDEVAYYNYVLSPGQILADYQLGTGVQAIQPTISLGRSNNQLIITYTGTLMSSPNAAGPYTPVAGAVSPYTVAPTGTQNFYRARVP